MDKRDKEIARLKEDNHLFQEAQNRLNIEIVDLRQKLTLAQHRSAQDFVKEVQTSEFLKKLGDEALVAEVIERIYATEQQGSWKFCLIDEFIARFKKLRWPGIKNE